MTLVDDLAFVVEGDVGTVGVQFLGALSICLLLALGFLVLAGGPMTAAGTAAGAASSPERGCKPSWVAEMLS